MILFTIELTIIMASQHNLFFLHALDLTLTLFTISKETREAGTNVNSNHLFTTGVFMTAI
jgi:hypothetical protein